MCSIFDRIVCSAWTTRWAADETLKENFPPRHSDYRDKAPPELASVYAAHQHLVQEGKWTFGLFDCWCPKVKMVKHSTHLPCWDSFKINPCKWRGIVFGRTLEECYWDGLRQTRWARTVYAANLGREYILPVRGVGRHGYKSEIKALCWMYFLMGCIFSCGIGQVFSLCGNFCFNFSACYSCHAREKIRRRYNLLAASWYANYFNEHDDSVTSLNCWSHAGITSRPCSDVRPGSTISSRIFSACIAACTKRCVN